MIVYTYKTLDYQESAKLVYAYGETGLISFLARGVMKLSSPLAFAAEPFRMLDVSLSNSALPVLKEATLIDRYPVAKDDLLKTMVHHVIGEILAKNITPEDDHVKLLSLLQKVLKAIENNDDAFTLLAVFMLKSLYFLGFGLQLQQCTQCHHLHDLGYDLSQLKTVCESHGARAHEKKMHQLIVHYLKADIGPDRLTAIPNPIVFLDALGRLYETHLDFQSKALKTLLRLLKKETV